MTKVSVTTKLVSLFLTSLSCSIASFSSLSLPPPLSVYIDLGPSLPPSLHSPYPH